MIEMNDLQKDAVEESINEMFKKALAGEPLMRNGVDGLVTNELHTTYIKGKSLGLNDDLVLKWCCVVLQNQINRQFTEKLNEVLASKGE